MVPDETTVGELARRMDRFELRHDRERAEADARCNARASTHVDSQLYAAERNHMLTRMADLTSDLAASDQRWKAKVEALESKLTWALRAAVTGVALPVIVLLVGWFLTRSAP